MEINPDLADVQSFLDHAIQKKSKIDAIVNDYAKSAQLAPNSGKFFTYFGTILQKEGFPDAAIDNFHKAISIDKTCSESFNNLGISLTHKGDFEEAIDSFYEAIKITPKYAEAYVNMGIALGHKGYLEEALDKINTALQIKPNFAQAYLSMGLVLDLNGKFSEAIQSCNRVLSLHSDEKNRDISKLLKISFVYISSSGIVDQTINVYETTANDSQIAVEILKEKLRGGLKIRVRKVDDLSPVKKQTLEIKIKEKLRNKNYLQISLLLFGFILIVIASMARIYQRW